MAKQVRAAPAAAKSHTRTQAVVAVANKATDVMHKHEQSPCLRQGLFAPCIPLKLPASPEK